MPADRCQKPKRIVQVMTAALCVLAVLFWLPPLSHNARFSLYRDDLQCATEALFAATDRLPPQTREAYRFSLKAGERQRATYGGNVRETETA